MFTIGSGAFEVLSVMKKNGLKADCMIYTTLISACAKAGDVDKLFEACSYDSFVFLVLWTCESSIHKANH
jgi:hypothetical protein